MSVTSLPFRKISAFPIGHSNDSSGTSSTAARYNVFGSNIMHGSFENQNNMKINMNEKFSFESHSYSTLSFMQANRSPFALFGPLGTTIFNPGVCAKYASGLCE